MLCMCIGYVVQTLLVKRSSNNFCDICDSLNTAYITPQAANQILSKLFCKENLD